jgi:hypothetical protein
MPGLSISTPADECISGSKMALIEGSVCSQCFAKRGHYSYDVVQDALLRRLYALNNPLWVPSMVTLITKACTLIDEPYFRWFDSGDLQGIFQLQNIVEVCNLAPEINHWLPTKEFKIVRDYQKQFGEFPKNLVVRASGIMIDGPPPKDFIYTSTVSRKHEPFNKEKGVMCKAYKNNNSCNDCRACWSREVFDVTYHKH